MLDLMPHRRAIARDEGLGLIEIVVAMFLLALVALALLPLLISGMKLAVTNTTVAAATQLANDRTSAAQAGSPDCARVYAVADEPLVTTDARGVELKAVTTVTGECPTAGASTLKVESVVTRTDTDQTLATASTLVLVAVEP